MKVILLKDVKNLGKKGDVVEASDGYARNYLVPRGIAEEATAKNVNIVKRKKASIRQERLEETEAAQEIATKIRNKELKIGVKVGENGRLFGAVTNKDVAELINKEYNLDIDRKKISMDPIKQEGTYTVKVRLYPGITSNVKILIEGNE
ncbi:MAG: 50S ribosomal protein L9 [Clostridium sp.]|nr:50S ribosomal protein L9 [Clostridium sp.]